jgi:anti-sigma regulatory factor (Ser/Thr protein kinase)
MLDDVMLTGGPQAAHAARSVVEGFVAGLSSPLQPELYDDLRLLVSELVTNSVRHGGVTELAAVTLRLSIGEHVIRVEVEDSGPGFVPRAPAPSPDRTSGFGLVLVEQLTSRWGVDVSGPVRLWFEIDVPPAGRGLIPRHGDTHLRASA